MSSVLFLILVLAGVLLSFVGGIIGIAQSFSESIVWGLLYLFVPFASLVFLVKFWGEREWVRKSFFMGLGGSALIVIAALLAPQEYGDFAATEGEYASFDQDELYASTDNGTSATYSTTTTADQDVFRDAINLATQASQQTQSATTKEEWRTVAASWQDSIELLGAVPSTDPNYAIAQTKITEYSKNLTYAQQNAQ